MKVIAACVDEGIIETRYVDWARNNKDRFAIWQENIKLIDSKVQFKVIEEKDCETKLNLYIKYFKKKQKQCQDQLEQKE